jgi:hypothetical protein
MFLVFKRDLDLGRMCTILFDYFFSLSILGFVFTYTGCFEVTFEVTEIKMATVAVIFRGDLRIETCIIAT